MNFWKELVGAGHVVGLSPMDGVTDLPMRWMTAKYGRSYPTSNSVNPLSSQLQIDRNTGLLDRNYEGVDVIYTEFVSVDGLTHAQNPDAVDRLMSSFLKLEDVGGLETYPYQVAQVFGHEPVSFYIAAVIIATLGFDGMDINMGCPAKNVSERGSGAGLIRTPDIAQELVRQAKEGMQDFAEGKVTIDDLTVSEAIKDWVRKHTSEKNCSHPVRQTSRQVQNHEITDLPDCHSPLPVSVKTRLGVDSIVVEEWMATLMDVTPAMITLHGRTLKQLYQGEANWEAIGAAATVVHRLGGHILGNGDVQSLGDGMNKVKMYGVDGFLIGRAAEGNPGIFIGNDDPPWNERKEWMLEHAWIFERVFGQNRFMPMRKHLAWYCKGFPGASELREKLVRSTTAEEVTRLIPAVSSYTLP